MGRFSSQYGPFRNAIRPISQNGTATPSSHAMPYCSSAKHTAAYMPHLITYSIGAERF